MTQQPKTDSKLIKDILNFIKNINKNPILIIILEIIILIITISFCHILKSSCNGLGNLVGTSVGAAVGSYKGYKDGKEDGLNPNDDTFVFISNKMQEIGNLQVLIAEDEFINEFNIGKKYKALFRYKAKTIFSVDLTSAQIINKDSDIIIKLPIPKVDFTIDENESEKLAEKQKHFWSGNSEDGYIAYMNSMKEVKKNAASEMTNYTPLMQQAKLSAKKQIQILTSSLGVQEKNIKIIFEGEVE